MGNLFSVDQALNRLGADVIVTSNAADFEKVDGIVLPGVGAFPDAMARLAELELIAPIQKTTKPLLGICLGMQLLLEKSEEGNMDCLGFLKGSVPEFTDESEKIPHMGWNQVTDVQNHFLFEVNQNGGFGNSTVGFGVYFHFGQAD